MLYLYTALQMQFDTVTCWIHLAWKLDHFMTYYLYTTLGCVNWVRSDSFPTRRVNDWLSTLLISISFEWHNDQNIRNTVFAIINTMGHSFFEKGSIYQEVISEQKANTKTHFSDSKCNELHELDKHFDFDRSGYSIYCMDFKCSLIQSLVGFT